MRFTKQEIDRVFSELGAVGQASWSASQMEERIPQLHRFLFLAKAWSAIPDERDYSWIDNQIAAAKAAPDQPFGGAGIALERLRSLGASDSDLTELVRAQMAEMLHHACYLLSDSDYAPDERYLEASLADTLDKVNWGLFETDDEFHPLGPIDCLHEDVLATDPMGREVRPLAIKPAPERTQSEVESDPVL